MIDITNLVEQYKVLKTKVTDLYNLLGIEDLEKKIKEIELMFNDDNFWNDTTKVNETTAKLSSLKNKYNLYYECSNLCEEIEVAIELLNDGDESLYENTKQELNKLDEQVSQLYNSLLLGGKFDTNNAIVDIHAGAGGTEAQDWVEMLYRMYTRYCNRHDFKINVISYHAGDPVGIKSVSFEVVGSDVFGLLKGERGVHRLIRISPFDSSGKRHTSFASIDVVPVINELDDIKVDKSELKIDTYRASGAGGQSVNTTDSAVRITHLPTGIVVSCQNERSQLKNKEYAMKLLLNRIAAKREEDRQKLIESSAVDKTSISWGSQIRSYVFQPYVLVKDHRTNYESGNVKNILDGNIDEFIIKYLEFINKVEVDND